MWVAEVFNQRSPGFFLDFGAFDGVLISNTLYLEKRLNWTGLCVEPNPRYFENLCKERNVVCINSALWPISRISLQFADAHGLSSIEEYINSDSNSSNRINATKQMISVDTINPTELMDRFNVPREIDYMSLDVEGAEMDVLGSMDFDKYKITLMTIEHNHVVDKKMRVRAHLANYGYDVVSHRNDDFFFLKDFPFPNNPKDVLESVATRFKVLHY